MSGRPLTIVLMALGLSLGTQASPLLTSGSPGADPFDKILIDDSNGPPFVSLAGDGAGTVSDIVFDQGVLTFVYTLAKNPSDHSRDGKWSQDYDFVTRLENPFDPTESLGIFRIQTVGGTGDAHITYADGPPIDLIGSQSSGFDSIGTYGFHTVATFTPDPSMGGDIGGAFYVEVPESAHEVWFGLALFAICLRFRKTSDNLA